MQKTSGRWYLVLTALMGVMVCTSHVSAQIIVENVGVHLDGNSSNAVNTLSFTVGAGDDRKLVVAINAENANDITSITYGGVALTNAARTGTTRIAEIWYLDNPAVEPYLIRAWAHGVS